MRFQKISVALMLCVATLCLSQVLCAQTSDANGSTPLTSKDYLKLMEQANIAAGIQPAGGNFVGAKPRPLGSLESSGPQSGPVQKPFAGAMAPASPEVQAMSTAGQSVRSQAPVLERPVSPVSVPQYGSSYSGISPGASAPIPGDLPSLNMAPAVTMSVPSPKVASEFVGINTVDANVVGSGLAPAQSVAGQTQESPMWFPPATVQPQLQPPKGTSQSQLLSESQQAQQGRSTKPWTGPRWVGRYASLLMYRPGDESMTYSGSRGLGSFGADRANDITVGYMTNPIDCYEFNYVGSLNWNRSLDLNGPVDSQLTSLDPRWLIAFQDTGSSKQTHASELSQYSLSRRWLTDDIGNSSLGVRVVDYSEQYRLESTNGNRLGRVGVDTDNVLVGLYSGIELWRPVSQRLAYGGSIDGGVYGSFAQASVEADDGDGVRSSVEDSDMSLAASAMLHLKARYQLRSWAGLYGGYRWMVLCGLASVDDQAMPVLSDRMSMSTSSDATILFHGFDAGIELKF